ncbi:MAG: hypothetical protein RLZZ57_2461 [Pseudomonadota bacterium]|jgi:GNAT superfamily N-acetyltransferase|nr:GNAT family N-acetyltransferase [Acetobacteraceae bacterium]NBS44173.1 GNAT family N-acetyltransferase [Acetobacteraceae bacterium]
MEIALDICIRHAKPEEADVVSGLIHSAGPEIYDYVFGEGRQGAREFIAAECRSVRGLCGYATLLVAVHAEQVVGVACFFDATEHGKMQRATLRNILLHYGFRRFWSVFARAWNVAPVLSRPGPQELCLRNFAVAPEKRGQGIGSALIRHGIAEARVRGLRRLILDVAENNPKARALYARLGFKSAKATRCRNPRAASRIPESICMILDVVPD